MKTLYESILGSTSDKVKDTRGMMGTYGEFEQLKKMKWKMVGKDGPITHYEKVWDCPEILNTTLPEKYLNDDIVSIRFNLNTKKGGKGGIVFNEGPTTHGLLFIQFLDSRGKECFRLDFYEYTSQGVKGVQGWADKFINIWCDNIETVRKGCEEMFRCRDTQFMGVIIKKITGKNHWQL